MLFFKRQTAKKSCTKLFGQTFAHTGEVPIRERIRYNRSDYEVVGRGVAELRELRESVRVAN